MIFTPPPVTNCRTFSDPSPCSVTYFMDGPLVTFEAFRVLNPPLQSIVEKPRMPKDFVDTLGTRRVETVDDSRDALPGIEQDETHIEDK